MKPGKERDSKLQVDSDTAKGTGQSDRLQEKLLTGKYQVEQRGE
jgi:hypothetical protein